METNNQRDHLQFDAFLSHSSEDTVLVRRLHRRIEQYKAPLNLPREKRELRIFHYHLDSPLSPALKKSLANRVSEIPQFVLAASPSASESEYVRFEIDSYLTSHQNHRIHVALLGGSKASAIPEGLLKHYPDIKYADLRTCGGNLLQWWLWQRRRLHRATLPLLASLFDVDQDLLIQRERKRRRNRLAGALAALVILLAALFLRFWITPRQGWVQAWPHENHSVSRVTLHRSEDGEETIRTLSLWNQHWISDVPDSPNGLVTVLNNWGKDIASLRYSLDAGGEWDISVDPGSVRGTLLNPSLPITQLRKPPQLGFGMKASLCSVEDGFLVSEMERLFEIDEEAQKDRAEKLKGIHDLVEPTVLHVKFYEFQGRRVLAGFHAYVGREAGQSGVIFQVTNDLGATWKSLGYIGDLELWSDVGIAYLDRDTFYMGFQMIPEYDNNNRLFRLKNGKPHQEIELPEHITVNGDWILEDIAVSHDEEYLAISVRSFTANPMKRLVMLSTDQGASWRNCTLNLPRAPRLKLAGVTQGGAILGHFCDEKEVGDLYLWRNYSILERIRYMGF